MANPAGWPWLGRRAVLKALRVVSSGAARGGIALPGDSAHRAEVAKIHAALDRLKIAVFWVAGDGTVTVESRWEPVTDLATAANALHDEGVGCRWSGAGNRSWRDIVRCRIAGLRCGDDRVLPRSSGEAYGGGDRRGWVDA